MADRGGGGSDHLSTTGLAVDAGEPLQYFPPAKETLWTQLAELWRYRELLAMFVMRDLRIRYRQVQLGVAWCLLQPTLGTLIFLAIFWLLRAEAVRVRGEGASLVATILIGMLLWQFVSAALRDATSSLVNYRHVITKIAFPRFALPAGSISCAAIDLAVASVLLPVVMLIAGDPWQWTAPLAIFPIAGLAFFVWGVAAWSSAANAFYRDVGFVLPFLLQIGMFVSPVIYDGSTVYNHPNLPSVVRIAYASNPIASAIDWTRTLVLGTPPPPMAGSVIAAVITIAAVWSGMAYFRRADLRLADRI